MQYTKEERLEIGKKIYENELSKYEASKLYGISPHTSRDYMRLYRDAYNLSPKNKVISDGRIKTNTNLSGGAESEYQEMTKEELIEELMRSRIREARLKKGYEVEGVGAQRKVIMYGKPNTK